MNCIELCKCFDIGIDSWIWIDHVNYNVVDIHEDYIKLDDPSSFFGFSLFTARQLLEYFGNPVDRMKINLTLC